MSAAPGRRRAAPVRSGRLAAIGVVLAFVAGCGTHDSTDREPERRGQPTAATSGPGAAECAERVDALIDSRTIPRADRDYAIGMCVDNR